ncbi:unnamed protein product, partial [Anisakis simplex]|uniref:Lig_chan-Glu_bd domain-containing protein n=1 Tax=Anisakis simplex TaxID=6269 RepID=A0A0M3J1F8_ANISI
GNWTEKRGWVFDKRFQNKWEFEIDPDAETLEGLTLRVVVYLVRHMNEILAGEFTSGIAGENEEEPFVMKTTSNAIGYEGFCIDLLIEMSRILKFDFKIIEVLDGTYGIEDETGKWNGLIGVLQRREADLSVSAVTITYSRAEVIGKCI